MHTPRLAGHPAVTERQARRQRCREAIQLVSHWCHRWYDRDGKWIDKAPAPDTRSTLWLCFGLLAGTKADRHLASHLIAGLHFVPHVGAMTANTGNPPFDIFLTNLAVHLLCLHSSSLDPTDRTKLEQLAIPCLRDYSGDRQADYQFQGYNDNMPAKATMGLILGGEYFGEPEAVAHGVWNLRQLRDLLTRRGLVSEYTSPTYLPLTLLNLNEVSRHAKHEEARHLAALCVERIWADILGHLHLPTGLMGGPYSRAYQADSTGHLSSLSFILWLWRGRGIFPNPLDELTSPKVRLVHHHSAHADAVGILGWAASAPVYPPRYLATWVERRRYPYSIRATAERGQFRDYDAGEILTSQHQEEDFSLGTAEGDSWTEGQTEAFFLNYKRDNRVLGVQGIRTAYLRYFINDEKPTDAHHLATHGRLHTVQMGRIALVLGRPALHLIGQKLHRLKMSLILPCHFGEVEDIVVTGGHVFIRDGNIHCSLRAMNSTQWGGGPAIQLEKFANYRCVSLFNYEGESRSFTREELGRTLTGFAACVAPSREQSFSEFQKRIMEAECVDCCQNGMRTVRYRLGNALLEMSYAVEADRVRFAAINGQSVSRPAWEADGLPSRRLPFLGTPAHPNDLSLPYSHLRVAWAPDLPWVISANGKSGFKAGHGAGWDSLSS